MIQISFQIEDEDLQYFRDIMYKVQETASKLPEKDIISRSSELMEQTRTKNIPDFISQRLTKLEMLVRMLNDTEWRLLESERQNVLLAIAYFTEPEDLIPDKIPVLGYLDDAIMIELVVRELRHEIDAYEDFCKYRSAYYKNYTNQSTDAREGWLEMKRKQLSERMRRRRERMHRASDRDSKKSKFKLF